MKKTLNGVEVDVVKRENYNDYRVILTHREVDCSTIDKETFAKALLEDVQLAQQLYSKMQEEYIEEENAKYVAQQQDRITREANRLYKRKSYIEKYINENFAKINHNEYTGRDIKNMHFETDQAAMGISWDCILKHTHDITAMEKCYEKVKNDYYFKKAKGWDIGYTVNNPDGQLLCNYWFKTHLILNDVDQQEQDDSVSQRAQDIARFYEGSNWWGD